MNRAVRLLAIAYAIALALHVLQTLLLQMVPYDARAYGVVVKALAIAFPLADVVLAGAFFAIARKAGEERLLAIAASVLAGLAVVVGFSGVSYAEPPFSLGANVLALLLLLNIASTRRMKILAGMIVVTIVLFPILRFSRSEDNPVAHAWVRWLVDAVRLGALAVFAFSARAANEDASRVEKGPYRAAAEGAPAPPAPTLSKETLVRAARGLSLYYLGFLGRVIGGTCYILVIIAMETSHERDVPVLFLIGPFLGIATAVPMIIGLARVRAFRPIVFAIIALVLAVAVDAIAIFLGLVNLVDRSSYSAYRRLEEATVFGWPLVAALGAVSVVVVAVALGRAGRFLDVPVIVRRSRAVQAFVCGVVFVGAGSIGALVMAERNVFALPIAVATAGIAFGCVVAAVVVHALLLKATLRATQHG